MAQSLITIGDFVKFNDSEWFVDDIKRSPAGPWIAHGHWGSMMEVSVEQWTFQSVFGPLRLIFTSKCIHQSVPSDLKFLNITFSISVSKIQKYSYSSKGLKTL